MRYGTYGRPRQNIKSCKESKEWSIQSFDYAGYNNFYDSVFHYATDMNKAKFKFSDDDGNDYILWAWKGDYLNLIKRLTI